MTDTAFVEAAADLAAAIEELGQPHTISGGCVVQALFSGLSQEHVAATGMDSVNEDIYSFNAALTAFCGQRPVRGTVFAVDGEEFEIIKVQETSGLLHLILRKYSS